jgi:hypothetical protein
MSEVLLQKLPELHGADGRPAHPKHVIPEIAKYGELGSFPSHFWPGRMKAVQL